MPVYTVEVQREVVNSLVSQLHDDAAPLRHSARKDKECVPITGVVTAWERAVSDVDAVARAFFLGGAAISTKATSPELHVIRLNPKLNRSISPLVPPAPKLATSSHCANESCGTNANPSKNDESRSPNAVNIGKQTHVSRDSQ